MDQFGLDDRLQEAKSRGVGADLPIPLHERLDALAERMSEARFPRPTKGRLLAALVLAAPPEPEALNELVRAYETASVRAALLQQPEEAAVIKFAKRRPGPRPRNG